MSYLRKRENAKAVKAKNPNAPDIPATYITCEYTRVITQTDKGILVDFGDTETWLPKSQCILWTEGKQRKISMPEQLYKSKGL